MNSRTMGYGISEEIKRNKSKQNERESYLLNADFHY